MEMILLSFSKSTSLLSCCFAIKGFFGIRQFFAQLGNVWSNSIKLCFQSISLRFESISLGFDSLQCSIINQFNFFFFFEGLATFEANTRLIAWLKKEIKAYISEECEARTVNRGPWSEDHEARTVKQGPWSEDREAKTVKPGPWSKDREAKARTVKQKRGPWSKSEDSEAKAKTVKQGPWSD